jgi:Ca-activated chloride channel family protein
VTDKALDFLGYRALRDLLGSLGKSSFGRHDTREQATGVETTGAVKPYEFGDTLNLDATSTLLNAVQREAEAERTSTRHPHPAPAPAPDTQHQHPAPSTQHAAPRRSIHVTHRDLMVTQGRVSKLVCDRADARLQSLDDSLRRGSLHAGQAGRAGAGAVDQVAVPGRCAKSGVVPRLGREIPLAELGRVRVGPYYTNTREGLRLARRILDRQRKDMRQIIMITDGKPSALTQPDGRIYKNAFGLDPFIVAETCAEVAACRKSGIMINTFMLARDYDLVSFVRRVAEICKGKAYFTTPYTLGQYVLMDYVNKKTRTIH